MLRSSFRKITAEYGRPGGFRFFRIFSGEVWPVDPGARKKARMPGSSGRISPLLPESVFPAPVFPGRKAAGKRRVRSRSFPPLVAEKEDRRFFPESVNGNGRLPGDEKMPAKRVPVFFQVLFRKRKRSAAFVPLSILCDLFSSFDVRKCPGSARMIGIPTVPDSLTALQKSGIKTR